MEQLGGFYGFRNRTPASLSGSIFFFGIPYREDCIPAASEHDAMPIPISIAAVMTLDRRIDESKGPAPLLLLVDSSFPTIKMLGRAIRNNGVVVESATDGYAALKMMKNKLYTMVIMDIQMPVMDGMESVRLLREFERSPAGDDAHQFIYGASASPDAAEECIDVGMDVFVSKPLDINRMMDVLRSLHHPL